MVRVEYKNRVLLDTGSKPSAQKRLSSAMQAVGQALANQQAELAAFKAKMAELRGAVKDIHDNVDDYADSVEKIDIDGLKETARKLRDDADDT
jgi:hypothetical protein